ncbi:hypothetical protein R3P38DRAFT_3004741 [Favolaschia claudopus]|uniref:Secreted protein n=1 Tax=Favolaschia claudopus TaxID=2862362 RepID=A0AAW0ALF2_9AGAR
MAGPPRMASSSLFCCFPCLTQHSFAGFCVQQLQIRNCRKILDNSGFHWGGSFLTLTTMSCYCLAGFEKKKLTDQNNKKMINQNTRIENRTTTFT